MTLEAARFSFHGMGADLSNCIASPAGYDALVVLLMTWERDVSGIIASNTTRWPGFNRCSSFRAGISG
jgi:hypothetical protein